VAGKGGSVRIKYQYRCDDEYFRAVIDRQYQQGAWFLRLPVQFGAVGAACALFVVASNDASISVRLALFVVVTGLVTAFGLWATRAGLMMKFKSMPGFGSDVAVSLSDTGVEVGAAKMDWSTYPDAIRFKDGILLKRRRSIRWLPDSAIIAGSSAEAINLVAAKTELRTIK
jgi:hypothetical protein